MLSKEQRSTWGHDVADTIYEANLLHVVLIHILIIH